MESYTGMFKPAPAVCDRCMKERVSNLWITCSIDRDNNGVYEELVRMFGKAHFKVCPICLFELLEIKPLTK